MIKAVSTATTRFFLSRYIILSNTKPDTYDHRVWKTGLPVRSAVLKPHAGELVVGWVTTSESSLLYVFVSFFVFCVSQRHSGESASDMGKMSRDRFVNWGPRP
ncbi:L-lysine 2-3-aminomutase [Penicillium chrysogenum]|nr:L-lysine 2-3-aminomutase [Penicillium chrysogenum]KAJ5252702.1 L-lysine 2-3-aminomutase [Penicillium chrysogenum]